MDLRLEEGRLVGRLFYRFIDGVSNFEQDGLQQPKHAYILYAYVGAFLRYTYA